VSVQYPLRGIGHRACRMTDPLTYEARMSALKQLLDGYRRAAATNREAGTYFQELTAKFLLWR